MALKTRSGWVEREGFPPYFFVEGDGEWRDPEGRRCRKVEVALPSDVPKARGEGRTYLADLPYVRRYAIDERVSFSPRPRVLYYDIEVAAEGGMPDPGNPRGRVLSVAAVDRSGREFFICRDDEGEIFAELSALLGEYDFLVGYNSGRRPGSDGFDLPYLHARARRIGAPFDHRGTCWGDLMAMYERVTQHRAGSLSSLVERVLGRAMEKPVARGAEILSWFEGDRGRLEEYNLGDCRALLDLDRELGLVDVFCELAAIARTTYTDAQSSYCVVDNLAVEEAAGRMLVFPTAEGEAAEGRPEGALVLDPVPGLHECHIYDFRSTYPSLIATFNISPETVRPEGIRTERLSFDRGESGVFPAVAERLMEERRRSSGLKAEALKVAANSIAGVMGFPGSRYYRKDLAESVTLTQRRILLMAKGLAEREGRRVLYGDSDSLFLDGPLDLEGFNRSLCLLLEYEYGVPPERFRMSLSYKGRWFVHLPPEKKRYVLFDGEGRVAQVKGYEAVRKNTPRLVARVEREIFQVIGSCIREPGSLGRRVSEYLEGVRRELMEGRLDAELVMRSGVGDPDAYKARNAPHVRAARRLREMGYPVREEVEYVIADAGEGGLRVEPVVGGRLPPITRRARRHYWESRVLPRVWQILGRQSQSLDSFIFPGENVLPWRGEPSGS